MSRGSRRILIGGGLSLLVVIVVVAVVMVGREKSGTLAAFSDDPLITCSGGTPFHASKLRDPDGCNEATVAQPGLSVANIVLDARHPIRPSTTELHVFVQGVACNDSVNTPKSKIVGPQVHVDPHRIVVTVAVKRSSDFENCGGAIRTVGGPPAGSEVIVKLDAPVGNRQVLDGTRFPYLPLAS